MSEKYKLVPVEPTREMWAAAGNAVVALSSHHHDAISEAVYKAMLAAAPDVQGEPVAQSDREAWLASLFPEDRMFEEIKSMATRTYQRHCASAKGQQISAADGIEHHWIWATKRWIEINEPAPATQTAEQRPAPEGWRTRFLKLMGEMHSDLDESGDDPIPSELWSLWRELLDTAPQPAEQQPTPAAHGSLSLSDEKILEIASNPMVTPCSPWWLKDDVKCGDVQNAAIAFARAVLKAATPAEQGEPVPDMPNLAEALRQYQHNDGSGLVFGYDKLLMDRHVAGLVEALECALETMENVDGANDCSRGIDAVEEALAAYRKEGEA